MTPKEKANILMSKFSDENYFSDKDILENAKLNALICVEEIIETKPLEKDYEDHGHRGRETWYNDKTDYWKEVKKELNNL